MSLIASKLNLIGSDQIARSSVSIVWHTHGDGLVRRIAVAIGSSDGDRVYAPAALT